MPYLFTPIAKQDTEQRIVYGIASTDTLDNQPGVMDGVSYAGDIVDPSAVKDALDDYLQWANVREMHNPVAAGTAIAADVINGKLMLAVKVVDDTAWKKVREGVYKGFSIGGRVLKAVLEKLPDGRYVRRILKLLLTEISLVDRPANPDARILVFKGTAMDKEEEEKTEESPQALAALQKLAEKVAPQLQLQKASADPAKIVALIQAARNECELGGDMQGAQLYTQAIALVMQASGEADATTEASETETSETETSEVVESAGAVALAAKATLKKAGKAISSERMNALKQAAKALVQMAADAGDEECMAALKAFGVGASTNEEGVELAAKAISSELEKVLTPFATVLTSIDARLSKVEAQPVAGGPVLRAVEKQLGSTKTSQKPQMPNLIKAQLDALWQKAHTDPNPAKRSDYLKQHNDLKAQYE
jgi:Phage head maturation protease